ncbi:MAG: rsmH [Chlamydiales bacterium]|jgi:16S rRNA (cytosine1402-N4)-methyltransferase|nr:rsmH [Chlamydiales bacterium]
MQEIKIYPHKSIFVKEFLEFFKDCKLSIFLDGTLGAGGHSEAILQAHPEIDLLIGIDQDPTALAIAKERLMPYREKTVFIQGNFAELIKWLDQQGVNQVDGMFFDFGVSSMQLDQGERGFSFNKNADLDMRMDPESELTAAKIVNYYSEQQLATIFREYGEERHWRAVARTIVEFRRKQPIRTTEELVNLLMPILGRGPRRKIHPLTLVFQGLRIAVNRELKVIEEMLPQALERLSPRGRLGAITFHSLEDRLVKVAFQNASRSNKASPTPPSCHLLTKKPLEATAQEMRQNPRSRSAKLRFIEKKNVNDTYID